LTKAHNVLHFSVSFRMPLSTTPYGITRAGPSA
jgi:hypothetical protein